MSASASACLLSWSARFRPINVVACFCMFVLAESYRPISLHPVLSKLAEKVILARLNDHLEREHPDSGAARVSPSSLHIPPTPQSR
ncbi:hypothetical protein TNIN_271111 [Trichonephila inaurata madagascariensis]|uniref:Uncharacterized protein n=1 Tax=Trichonephila inaurata madagascariensis TaxID=2747483 RepID=A0A8X6WMZ3_9ARAC|nr:hypothetical protein TNIN_271111 [Trichonephila inaurata madagascariensis]